MVFIHTIILPANIMKSNGIGELRQFHSIQFYFSSLDDSKGKKENPCDVDCLSG